MKDDRVPVMLSGDLCRAAMEELGDQFASVEEMLTFVLTQLTRPDLKQLDESEEQMIQDRLRDLGYV